MKQGRMTDEQDSTVSVWWNYILAAGVIGGLITLDVLTQKGFLDGTIIGMILMKALDSLTKMNDYFFPGRSRTAPNDKSGGQHDGK